VRLVDRAIVQALPVVPKPIVRRVAGRYIAGTGLPDACRVVRKQNEAGKLATIDVLGEEITSADEARAIASIYRDVLEAIEREELDSGISVKPTALGLKLGYGLCRELLEEVVRDAASRGNFVRIDMEDSSCTDDTLRLYRELHAAGLDNVGIVLQACLRRTLDDVAALADLKPGVRLCKGIYAEATSIAFDDPDEIRRSFLRVLEALLAAGSGVAVATHDEWLIGESLRRLYEAGLARGEYELQFLLGVRPERADALVREGHRLRVYVPFGARWYEYSLRRMQENPRLAGQIALSTLERLFR
jgi:proline dehydrogenase